jgi:glucan phosphorylase
MPPPQRWSSTGSRQRRSVAGGRRVQAIVSRRRRDRTEMSAVSVSGKVAPVRTIVRRVVHLAEAGVDQGVDDEPAFIFIEDYDIGVGRYLVQGVEVWLNNPRRPLEACGTSGQKVVLNGGSTCRCSTAGGPKPATG